MPIDALLLMCAEDKLEELLCDAGVVVVVEYEEDLDVDTLDEVGGTEDAVELVEVFEVEARLVLVLVLSLALIQNSAETKPPPCCSS